MADIDIRIQEGSATARLNQVATPIVDTDAANKAYVDANRAFAYSDTETYSFGELVFTPDGLIHEYINSTPAAGIDPAADADESHWLRIAYHRDITDQRLEDHVDVAVHGTVDETVATQNAYLTGSELQGLSYQNEGAPRGPEIVFTYRASPTNPVDAQYAAFFGTRANPRQEAFIVRLNRIGDTTDTIDVKFKVHTVLDFGLAICTVLSPLSAFADIGITLTSGLTIPATHVGDFFNFSDNPGASVGQVLTWDGSQWTNTTPTPASTGDSLNVPNDLNLNGNTLQLRRGTTNIDTVDLPATGPFSSFTIAGTPSNTNPVPKWTDATTLTWSEDDNTEGVTSVSVLNDTPIAASGVTLVETAANGFTLNFATANQATTDAVLNSLFVTAMGLSAVPGVGTNNTSTRNFTLRFGDGQTHPIDASVDNFRIVSTTSTSIQIAITDSSNDGRPNAITTATSLVAEAGSSVDLGDTITLESLNSGELDIEAPTAGRVTFEVGPNVARTSQIPTTGTVPSSWDDTISEVGRYGFFAGEEITWVETLTDINFVGVTAAAQSSTSITYTLASEADAIRFADLFEVNLTNNPTLAGLLRISNTVFVLFGFSGTVTRIGRSVSLTNVGITGNNDLSNQTVGFRRFEVEETVIAERREFTVTPTSENVVTLTGLSGSFLASLVNTSRAIITRSGVDAFAVYSVVVSGTTATLSPIISIDDDGITPDNFDYTIPAGTPVAVHTVVTPRDFRRLFSNDLDTPTREQMVVAQGQNLIVGPNGTVTIAPFVTTTGTRIIDATTPNVIAFDAQSNYGINEFDAITTGADTPINPLDSATTHQLTTQFLSPVQNGTTHQINTTWVNQINGGYGTFVNGNVYAVVINDSRVSFRDTNNTVLLFRAAGVVTNNIPDSQVWLNDGLATASVVLDGITEYTFEIRNFGTLLGSTEAAVRTFLEGADVNRLDLSQGDTQVIALNSFTDLSNDNSVTVNGRIAAGNRIAIRIQREDTSTGSENDDTYVEVLSASLTDGIAIDRNDKFTLDSAGRTEVSTDTRQIIFDSTRTEVDGQLHYIQDQALVIVEDIAGLQTQITSNDTDIAGLQTQITSNDTDIADLQGRLRIVSELPNSTTGTIGELVSLTGTDTSSGLTANIYRRVANNGNDQDWISDAFNNAVGIGANAQNITDNSNREQSNQILNNQTDTRQEAEISSIRQQLSNLANSIGDASFVEQTPTASIPLNTDRLITRQSWDMAARANIFGTEASDSTLRTSLDVPLLNTALGPNRVDLSFIAELNNLTQSGSQIGYDDNDYVYLQPTEAVNTSAAVSAQYTTTTLALPRLIPPGQGIAVSLPGPSVVAGENPQPVTLLYNPLPVTRTDPAGSGIGEFAAGLQTVLNAEFTADGVTPNRLRNLYTVTGEVISGGRGRFTFTRTDSATIEGIAGYSVSFISDPADTYHSLRLEDSLNSLVQTRLGHPAGNPVTSQVPFADTDGNDLFNGYAPIIRVISTSGTSNSAITAAEWLVAPGTANYTYTDNNTTLNREYQLQTYTSITDAIVNEADLQTIGNTDSGIKRVVLSGFVASNLTTYDEAEPNAWIIVNGSTTPNTTTTYAHILDMGLVQGSTTQYYAEIDTDHLYLISSDGDLVLNETNFRTRLSGSYVLYSRNVASGGGVVSSVMDTTGATGIDFTLTNGVLSAVLAQDPGTGSLPEVVTITDNGSVTEIRPASGNTSIDINDGLVVADETLHRVTIPITSGLTLATGVGTPTSYSWDIVNADTNTVYQWNLNLTDETGTDVTVTNTGFTQVDAAGAVTNLNAELVTQTNGAWEAAIVGNEFVVRTTTDVLRPERTQGDLTIVGNARVGIGTFADAGIVDLTPTYAAGGPGTATDSLALITITPTGQAPVSGTTGVIATDLTAAQLATRLAAVPIAGYTLEVVNTTSLQITRDTEGSFTVDSIIYSNSATGGAQGTQVVRDFVVPIADFRSTPTVNGVAIDSAVNGVIVDLEAVVLNRFFKSRGTSGLPDRIYTDSTGNRTYIFGQIYEGGDTVYVIQNFNDADTAADPTYAKLPDITTWNARNTECAANNFTATAALTYGGL